MKCAFCHKENQAVQAVPKHNINGNQPYGLTYVCGNAKCLKEWVERA